MILANQGEIMFAAARRFRVPLFEGLLFTAFILMLAT
jgi:hypothetical protein